LTPKESVEKTKLTLDKYNLPPVQKVEVKDPFTGHKKIVKLDRTGTHEQKLIVALADPKLNQDQKDNVLSMYLFERGKESASFLAELFRYKGHHTKESRVFQTRMRFDFEMFVNMFIEYLRKQAEVIGKICKVNVEEEKERFRKWLQLPNNKAKGYTYIDFCETQEGVKRLVWDMLFIQLAINNLDEAEYLREEVDKITRAREAQKGGGIYIDSKGQPFSINDPNLDDIIKQDKKLQNDTA